MKAAYRMNRKKVLETLVYAAEHCPGADFHKLLKIIFYADKFHIQRYGRPVCGDTHKKMFYGPVASHAYDLLKGNRGMMTAEEWADRNDALEHDVSGMVPTGRAKRSADRRHLSITDMECLDEAIDLCRDRSFYELCAMSHQEKGYQSKQMNEAIDFEDLLDDNDPDLVEKSQYIRETAPTLVL